MRVLLVTGQLAKSTVLKYAKELSMESQVVDLPMAVAALMTPKYIARLLLQRDLAGFDLILVPGLIAGDISSIEELTGIKTFKGPRHAADIPPVMENFSKLKLSKTLPACDLMKVSLRERALNQIDAVEKNKATLLRRPWNMTIGELAIGSDFPVRVMAEIVDAPLLSDVELVKKARYYVQSGADIVDVGMIANETHPKDAQRAVRVIRNNLNVPVSIDSMSPKEVEAGVNAGAQIILSIDGGNMNEMAKIASRATSVIIPTNFRKQVFPKDADERVKLLEENIRKAHEKNLTKIMADPILDPIINPGVIESLAAYYKFRKKNPNIILFMGVGNITELTDVDTPGINTLLTGICAELGVGVILTTEVSDKARGSVKELAIASKMMFVAKARNTTPKGVGLDLHLMRDKKLKEESRNSEIEDEVRVVKPFGGVEYRADPKGWFKIYVDRDVEEIFVYYFSNYRIGKPTIIFRGKNSLEIYRTIIKENVISRLDHAAYIGSEIQKASLALKLGKSYLQDQNLYK